MVELRCNRCKYQKTRTERLDKKVIVDTDYCRKLKEPLPNGFAMLHFGGAVNNPKYSGICGGDKRND